jgi:hypothetical protein
VSSTVRGLGRYLGAIGDTSNLIALADVFPADRAAPVVADWFFPYGPPTPIQIPFAWLTTPLSARPDKPFTTATVTQTGGSTARGKSAASLAEYGQNNFSAALSTAVDADPGCLTQFVLAYYATPPGSVPRTRFPTLRLILNGRTPSEQMRILGLALGTRITITGVPVSWPAGASQQVIEGIRQSGVGSQRVVEWNTSPVIGAAAGVSGPWFRADSSLADGTDVAPF